MISMSPFSRVKRNSQDIVIDPVARTGKARNVIRDGTELEYVEHGFVWHFDQLASRPYTRSDCTSMLQEGDPLDIAKPVCQRM